MELCLALRSLHLRQAKAITEPDVHDVQVSPLGDSMHHLDRVITACQFPSLRSQRAAGEFNNTAQ